MAKRNHACHLLLLVYHNQYLVSLLNQLADDLGERRVWMNGDDSICHYVAHPALEGEGAHKQNGAWRGVGNLAGGTAGGRTQGMFVAGRAQNQQVAVSLLRQGGEQRTGGAFAREWFQREIGKMGLGGGQCLHLLEVDRPVPVELAGRSAGSRLLFWRRLWPFDHGKGSQRCACQFCQVQADAKCLPAPW